MALDAARRLPESQNAVSLLCVRYPKADFDAFYNKAGLRQAERFSVQADEALRAKDQVHIASAMKS